MSNLNFHISLLSPLLPAPARVQAIHNKPSYMILPNHHGQSGMRHDGMESLAQQSRGMPDRICTRQLRFEPRQRLFSEQRNDDRIFLENSEFLVEEIETKVQVLSYVFTSQYRYWEGSLFELFSFEVLSFFL
jgi:hypothetical protein